jgi:hypothetical protein
LVAWNREPGDVDALVDSTTRRIVGARRDAAPLAAVAITLERAVSIRLSIHSATNGDDLTAPANGERELMTPRNKSVAF